MGDEQKIEQQVKLPIADKAAAVGLVQIKKPVFVEPDEPKEKKPTKNAARQAAFREKQRASGLAFGPYPAVLKAELDAAGSWNAVAEKYGFPAVVPAPELEPIAKPKPLTELEQLSAQLVALRQQVDVLAKQAEASEPRLIQIQRDVENLRIVAHLQAQAIPNEKKSQSSMLSVGFAAIGMFALGLLSNRFR